MTVSRQQNLFAAEDWKIAYKVFNNVNFQAYDFDTMRLAMVDYIKTNFPENFNDYIESSEFISIIELLAYLAQSLAFRMDLNSRENFLETAERRDSVFKLARMLGYNPKRNVPASGLLKIVNIKTTENITDSLGTTLNNRNIYWDDENNTQSYEQFITILNSAMSKTNRFTSPIKSGEVGNVKTELYQLNTPAGSPIAYNFTLRINGTERNFNVCNPDFEDEGYFYERHPDPTNLFNLIYRNDSKGSSSADTGFFLFFRQGILNFLDFNYTTPVENRTQDLAVANINESDVYLQEIDTIGAVVNKWTKVPNTVGQTLTYNTLALNSRNLYSVENLGTSGIRVRYSDGNFANVPQGVYRLWHRTSDPERYSIQPQNARNIVLSVPYTNNIGEKHTLSLTCSLQYTVNNSLPAESIAAIKERAPQTFYTQNRMVNAQDYNVFPLSQSNNILKLKATNRTHAGHSRYIDINDPTGTFQNIDSFADDAYLYIDDRNPTETIIVNSNVTPLELATSIIPNRLKGQPVNNFVYYTLRNIWIDPAKNGIVDVFEFSEADNVLWNPLPSAERSKTGYLTETFTTGTRNILVNNVAGKTEILKQNNFIKFVNPIDSSEYKWCRIINVENSGALSAGVNTSVGPWTLSEEIEATWQACEVIVSLRKLFTVAEAELIQTEIRNKRSFGLGYNLQTDTFYIIPDSLLTADSKAGKFALDNGQAGAYSWLVLLNYSPVDQFSYRYDVTLRGNDYVVQSRDDIRFYNVKNSGTIKDKITFTTVNTRSGDTETFSWQGTTFLNSFTGTTFEPIGISANLPLKTRATTWKDLEAQWVSNFGLLKPINSSLVSITNNNQYVSEASTGLNVYFKTGALASESNLVIAANTGLISVLPSKITVPFNNTTFGVNVVESTGTPFIAYRQLPNNGVPGTDEVIFKAEEGGVPYSYGEGGNSLDSSTVGRLYLLDYNPVTETGNIEYRNIQNHDLHSSSDITGAVSRDKLVLRYITNKEKLSVPIDWELIDTFKESDGYVDPRKVKVAPIDTDRDLVPDRPLQFSEYVNPEDYVLFEYYKDFDGTSYDIPVSGVIADFRREDNLLINNTAGTVTPLRYTDIYSFSDLKWIIVKNDAVANLFINISSAAGLVIFSVGSGKVFQVTRVSTSDTELLVLETSDYFVRIGRGKNQNTASDSTTNGIIRWQHNASSSVRVDPSISNIVEMILLTQSYNDLVNRWKSNQSGEFPIEPTTDQLSLEFSGLNTYKTASDTLVFRSSKFKLLFGNQADEEFKAKFRVVKLSDQISDNELKSGIISTINEYFDVNNWEFGETFYFTELSTYIHQKLGSNIGSIVILPKNISGKFGELFQVKAESNELFISTASVNDIEIISRIDNQTLRADI